MFGNSKKRNAYAMASLTKLIYQNTWAKFKISRLSRLLFDLEFSIHGSQLSVFFFAVTSTYRNAKSAKRTMLPIRMWRHDASIWFSYWGHSPRSLARRRRSAAACSTQPHCSPPPGNKALISSCSTDNVYINVWYLILAAGIVVPWDGVQSRAEERHCTGGSRNNWTIVP